MIQRVLALVKMELLKLIREPANLFLNLLFPAILTLVFGLAFGGLGGGDSAIFDSMAPGLFAYACIFIIMTVSMSFTDDREHGLLKRINVTPTTSTQFIGSYIITNMLIAVIQLMIVFLLSLLMGFRPNVDVFGVIMAFIFMLLLSLSSVGLGLITATIAKSAGAAAGISFIFILPQMFFGTFIPLSDATRVIGVFLPSYYVTDAITAIFNGVAPFTVEILAQLGIIALMSIVIVILGIFLFKKYGKV
ncbi:MAG: ABC transporter permease [Candidatus Lokiarchaeota archaeon]|jgi:ABC-2 type transport system permease protein|nr:ABC transporter permease [Candidatus Lokiarchaeota archaeon]